MNSTKRVNEYYIGKNKAVAVLEEDEFNCEIINNSDYVVYITQITLDFDDDENETVKAIKTNGHFIYDFNPENLDKMLTMK